MSKFKNRQHIYKIRNQGKQLKLCRQYRQLTLTELSNGISGLTPNKISRFEKGMEDLTEDQKKLMMVKLKWPYEFLNKRASNITFIN